MLTLKSSVNFVLYCWFSEKFWATIKRLFCFCDWRNRMKMNTLDGTNPTAYFGMRKLSSTNVRETTFTFDGKENV